MGCPACGDAMQRRSYERRPHGSVDLDLCFGCHAIWFDQYESAQLAPGAVVSLFREIQSHPAAPRIPGASAACPKCRARLVHTHDMQRTNRITYHRCPQGHGRLTTFFQFLREKQFVRSLTSIEIARLRATVAQVQCSSCGAPISLDRDAQCGFCQAPISILDAKAVETTLAELETAERKRTAVDPTAAIDALLAGQRIERKMAYIEGRSVPRDAGASVDLVSEALDVLLNLYL